MCRAAIPQAIVTPSAEPRETNVGFEYFEKGEPMSHRKALEPIVAEVLKSAACRLTIVEVAKSIWAKHEADLRSGGDLFYVWQYEMRWAAQKLVDEGKVEKTREGWKWL